MIATNVVLYFRERFPLLGVTLISTIFALFIFCLEGLLFNQKWFLTSLLLVVTFAAFLLRQRITDEFKDKRHDNMYFHDRPFQRGLVTSKELVSLGVIAFVIEIGAVLFIGGIHSIIWYSLVLVYSALMAKEFFMNQWLSKHFTVYFLIHEAIFVFFAIWVAQIVNAPFNLTLLAWTVALTAVMMSLEIGRKFELRMDSKGRVVNDTYSAVWGRDNSISTIAILMMATGIALSYSSSLIIFALISAAASLVLSSLSLSDRSVKIVIILHVVLIVLTGVLT